MTECNWDPNKHNGRPCPIHGSSGQGKKYNVKETVRVHDDPDMKKYTITDKENIIRGGADTEEEAYEWLKNNGEYDEEAFDDDYNEEFDSLDKPSRSFNPRSNEEKMFDYMDSYASDDDYKEQALNVIKWQGNWDIADTVRRDELLGDIDYDNMSDEEISDEYYRQIEDDELDAKDEFERIIGTMSDDAVGEFADFYDLKEYEDEDDSNLNAAEVDLKDDEDKRLLKKYDEKNGHQISVDGGAHWEQVSSEEYNDTPYTEIENEDEEDEGISHKYKIKYNDRTPETRRLSDLAAGERGGEPIIRTKTIEGKNVGDAIDKIGKNEGVISFKREDGIKHSEADRNGHNIGHGIGRKSDFVEAEKNSDYPKTGTEATFKNALSFAKREMNKYVNEPGTYGGIEGMIEGVAEAYYLRQDEKDLLKQRLKEYAQKMGFNKWLGR